MEPAKDMDLMNRKEMKEAKEGKPVGRRLPVRAAALFLAVLTAFMMLPISSYTDENGIGDKTGADFTTNSYISQRLQLFFDRLVYSSTPYFTTMGSSSCGNTACALCGLKAVCSEHPALKDLNIEMNVVSYGSGAFARFAFYMIFGRKLATINLFGNETAGLQTIGRVSTGGGAVSGAYDAMSAENLERIMRAGTPGDLIQARSSSGGNHTMVFLSADGVGVTVLHSIDYAVSGISYNRVIISKIDYSSMLVRWNQVISLMRAEEDVYKAAWAKGGEIHTTHTYTDESKNLCTTCGFVFTPVSSYEKAGVYKATKNAVSYNGCYRSTGQAVQTFSKGTYIVAAGSVVNSTGVRFYILEDGSYVSSEDFVTDTADTPTITGEKLPSGTLTMGESFSLKGYFRMESKLSSIAGYILSDVGSVVQVKKMKATDVSVKLETCDINSALRFSTLGEGKYLFMLTAAGSNGKMSSLTSAFEVKKPPEKPTPATPSAPTLSSKTANSVTLVSSSGYEYRMSGGSWQTSAVFTGLSPATEYTFYRRKAETSTYRASEQSEGLKVTTDKAEAARPSAPTLSSATASSITLKKVDGCEYRKSGGSWQTSPTFTGLSPATEYTFYQRYAATGVSEASEQSPSAVFSTKKADGLQVGAPNAEKVTSTSITLKKVDGCEYRKSGGSWQTSPTFAGLSPATEYTFYQRYAATDVSEAGEQSPSRKITTAKFSVSPPSAPELKERSDVRIVLKSAEGIEYSRDGGKTWQSSAEFKGLSPNTAYSFVCRYAETDRSAPSEKSEALQVRTTRSSVPAPSKPTLLSLDGMKVTLRAESGMEYSADGGKTWQTSSSFTVSSYGSHSFVRRYEQTDDSYASPASEALIVRVEPTTLTSSVLTVLEDKREINGAAAGTSCAQLSGMFAEKAFIVLTDEEGRELSGDTPVFTGLKIRLPGGKTYVLSVRGDVNGDGDVNVFDLSVIRGQILDGGLSGAQAKSADVNGDGSVDVFDYVTVRNCILDGTAP